MSSLRPCQQKIQRQLLSPFSMLIPPHEIRRSRNDHPTIQACVGRGTAPKIPHDGHVPQMRIARGTCVIAQCRPCAYKCTLTAVIISFSTLARTLAPPLALDDAGDEALRCRNLSDAIFTPTADIILSAVAVGLLRRQVRARTNELLGLISHSV